MTESPRVALRRTRQQWQAILRARGIRPEKSMGQNFLVEPDVVEDIVAEAGILENDIVVEIGPGLGMLTRDLASTGANVIAIELDRELKRFLDEDLADLPNVRVVEANALHANVVDLVGKSTYKVVANLPYSTGTAIARRFLEYAHPPATMTVMLQREVAERMAAEPPHMSLLALATQIHAVASITMFVPPDVFHPPPKVESAIVHLVLRDQPLVERATAIALFHLATMAFQRKRKTLSNGLSQGLGMTKADVDRRLAAAGIDPRRRPETLSVEDWIAVTSVFRL